MRPGEGPGNGGRELIYRVLADLVVVTHLAFVAFVILGGFLAFRWPRAAWLHVPAVVWGVAIELTGWVCPLTPLENRLRVLGGGAGYSGGFVEHYLMPVLYPIGLTRGTQVVLGIIALGLNLAIYAVLWHRWRSHSAGGSKAEEDHG